MATTVAEAEAQTLVLPARLQDWRRFARLMNGYAIAKELNLDLNDWVKTQDETFQRTGLWTHLTVLELRLMLFVAYRSDYFSGYTYHEHDESADRLLRAIAQKLNQPDPATNPLWYADGK